MTNSAATAEPAPAKPAAKGINLRTPEVMAQVQTMVENHYHSALVEEARANGGVIARGKTTVRIAKEFGFCYGVERAVDLAYAASKVFAGRRIFIIGEIIHNPDVNQQIAEQGIMALPTGIEGCPDLTHLTADDVVIFPAFGAEASVVNTVKEIGCPIVDTTCGDVMSVWKRVRQNAREQVTSIIHGKTSHEETRATASRALGDGGGHYLIVLDLEETLVTCDFIRNGGDAAKFLRKFAGAHSPGFDPASHLRRVGVANQTTMLRSETEEVQRLVREAVAQRDGGSLENYRFFDTICGATQDRQDALFAMLRQPPDLLLVIGGYNSSNTSHLVEIGSKKCPTYFVRDHRRLISGSQIRHFCLGKSREFISENWLPEGPLVAGVTAGASCPNNLIGEVIERIFALRGEKL